MLSIFLFMHVQRLNRMKLLDFLVLLKQYFISFYCVFDYVSAFFLWTFANKVCHGPKDMQTLTEKLFIATEIFLTFRTFFLLFRFNSQHHRHKLLFFFENNVESFQQLFLFELFNKAVRVLKLRIA